MSLPSLTRSGNRTGGQLQAVFRIETPMFLGGAEPKERAELRLPSLKGVLRWWWRALSWSRAVGDGESRLRTIRDREFGLFGAAADGADQGAGRFRMAWTPGLNVPEAAWSPRAAPALIYLAGQGLYEQRTKTWPRPALAPGQTFSLTVTFSARATATDKAELLEAIQVMGVLGGLGARSRRGMGSLRLVKLVDNGTELLPSGFGTLEGLKATLAPVLERASRAHDEPPYSAFWRDTRIVAVQGKSAEPMKVLEELGKEMVRFRAFGSERNGDRHTTVLSEPAEQNFTDDHDAVLQAGQQHPIAQPPRRAVFGLPHNYFFSSRRLNVDVKPSGTRIDRRASPLLLHAHGVDGGNAVGVLSFFPSRFLPPGVQIQIGQGRRPLLLNPRPPATLWQPIHDYLGRFLDSRTRPGQAPALQLQTVVDLTARGQA